MRRLATVVAVIAAALGGSAALFVLGTWPGIMPRTWIGWALAAVLGAPVWFLGEGLLEFALGDLTRPKDELERRYSLEEIRQHAPAAARAKRGAAVLLRIAVGLAAFGLLVWLIVLLSKIPFVQAQFGSSL